MKTNQHTKWIRLVSTLVTALWLAITCGRVGATSNGAVSAPQAAASTTTSSVPIYTPHAYGDLLSSGNEIPEQRKRVDELVASLKQENWDQSLENLLTNGNQFFDLGIGFEPLGAEAQLEQMLSARRAIKILYTLQALPMNSRIEKCRELFDRVRHASEDMYVAAMRKKELGTAREYEPLVPGRTLGLALFATAELGRRDILAEQFEKLNEFGRYGTSIDTRFQLNVLRLAVSRDPSAPSDLLDQIDTYCRSMGMEAVEVQIVPWDARTTLFEFRVGHRPYTSKGVTKYLFYDWSIDTITDEMTGKSDRKREILQNVRDLALKS